MKTVTFRLDLKRVTLTDIQVLEFARAAIAKGLPREAQRFKHWAVVVDDSVIGLKWLFSRVTGIPEIAYAPSLARRIFQDRLGLEVVNLSNERARRRETKRFEARTRRSQERPTTRRKHRITRDEYREFFQSVEARLSELLPAAIQAEPHHFQARANFWQVIFDEFGGCHYQITLRRDDHEIGLHFESTRQASHARLATFQPHIEELSKSLGERVQTGTMGPRGAWTRIWLEREVEPLNESLASAYAAQLARFIAATFPLLPETAHARTRKTERGNGARVEQTNPAYLILEHESQTIRAFLEGRSDHRPTDEKICDWIQFCYWFELYAEGRDLYKLVLADGVNPWYLERTRKLAKICELRAR